jgi:BMFP domain-containing protein YqiC
MVEVIDYTKKLSIVNIKEIKMTEEIKSVDAKVDELEAAAKKYASKDTVISIGGYEFTPAKLMVAFTLVSSTLGGLYGAFEVYKDYQSMKKRIAEYVAPDLSVFDKRLAVIEENSQKATDYTRDIKNDLKQDVRRVESVVEQVERNQKQSSRETEQAVQAVRSETRATTKEVEQQMKEVSRETQNSIKQLQREVDNKIKQALDNPLAGK